MDLHVDDDGFVRAPAAACYRALTDVSAWAAWWPRTVVDGLGEDRFEVAFGPRPRRVRLGLTAHGWRHDQGFRLSVTGDLEGDVEFWLEPGWGGTVVHHLATLRTGHGRRGPLRAYRRWARAGLWGVKDRVQVDAVGEGAV